MPFSTHSSHADQPSASDPQTRINAIANRLCQAMIEAAVPPGMLKTLAENRPEVVVFQAPTPDWVDYFEHYLQETYPKAMVLARQEAGQKSHTQGLLFSLMLALHCRTVVAVSQDPDGLFPQLLRDVSDHRYMLKRPDLPMVQAVIMDLTAASPRKLRTQHLEGLSATQLLAGLRPAGSAGAMAKRLIAIAAQARGETSIPDGHKIAELDLPQEIRIWADRVAADLPLGKTEGLEHALIFGPPGTGKTHLVHALAASAGLPLIMTNAGRWLVDGRGHLNDVLNAQKAFFAELGRMAPCIGVVDEIDTVPNRTALNGEYDSWWTGFANGVLTQIDQLNAARRPVLLVGITNSPNRLDPALIRAGRLGRHLELPLPRSAVQRLNMLRLHLPEPLKSQDLSVLLPLLSDQSQAELKQIAVKATGLAAETGRAFVLDHLMAVLAPPDARSSDVRRSVALHEAGHAVMAVQCGKPVQVVSIQSGGGWEGQTMIDKTGPVILTRKDVEDDVRILLAGRAADIICNAGPNSGARFDLVQAADKLADALLELRFYGPPSQWSQSDAGPNDMRNFVEQRLADLLAETVAFLTPLRPALEAVAAALVERTALSGEDLTAVLASAALPNPASSNPR